MAPFPEYESFICSSLHSAWSFLYNIYIYIFLNYQILGQQHTFHVHKQILIISWCLTLHFAPITFLGCSRSINMLGFIFFQCVILIDLLCHISFQLGYNECVCVPNAVHECFWIITIPRSCTSRRHPANDQSPEELVLPLKHYIL